MTQAFISAAFWLAMSAVAIAQTGGYPASPSHGIIGTAPDGTPHYGTEPGKQGNQSSETVGRSGPDKPGDQNDQDAPPHATSGSRDGPKAPDHSPGR
jgi:hypothetical protein